MAAVHTTAAGRLWLRPPTPVNGMVGMHEQCMEPITPDGIGRKLYMQNAFRHLSSAALHWVAAAVLVCEVGTKLCLLICSTLSLLRLNDYNASRVIISLFQSVACCMCIRNTVC